MMNMTKIPPKIFFSAVTLIILFLLIFAGRHRFVFPSRNVLMFWVALITIYTTYIYVINNYFVAYKKSAYMSFWGGVVSLLIAASPYVLLGFGVNEHVVSFIMAVMSIFVFPVYILHYVVGLVLWFLDTYVIYNSTGKVYYYFLLLPLLYGTIVPICYSFLGTVLYTFYTKKPRKR